MSLQREKLIKKILRKLKPWEIDKLNQNLFNRNNYQFKKNLTGIFPFSGVKIPAINFIFSVWMSYWNQEIILHKTLWKSIFFFHLCERLSKKLFQFKIRRFLILSKKFTMKISVSVSVSISSSNGAKKNLPPFLVLTDTHNHKLTVLNS